nr:MAG: capsid protein [Cressdnaviricota sp.]
MSSTTIRMREYLGDILTSASAGAFLIQSFSINPGQAGTFPWLCSIAGNYLLYDINRIQVEFLSTSATALSSTNTALGIVALRIQYDPTVSADTSLIQMNNSFECIQANPSKSIALDYDMKNKLRRDYSVRTGSQPANTDLRNYDMGYFEIATQGTQAANVNIGQLWINYEVTLAKPLYIQGELGYTIRSANYSGTGTVSAAAPLGSTAMLAGPNNYLALTSTTAGASLGVASSNKIYFPVNITQGTYLVCLMYYGAAANSIVLPIPTYTNCSAISEMLPASGGVGTAPNSANVSAPVGGTDNSAQAILMMLVSINAPGSTQALITLGTAGTLPAPTVQCQLLVTQWNGLM